MPKVTVWLTGMPCSGKTTIARILATRMRPFGPVVWLDGDRVRATEGNNDFTRDGRCRHIKSVVHRIADLPDDTFAVASFVSPYYDMRAYARAFLQPFCEVYVYAPYEVCKRRDVKGMYARAAAGEIAHFTGVGDGYEPPVRPEVIVRTDAEAPEMSAGHILGYLTCTRLIAVPAVV